MSAEATTPGRPALGLPPKRNAAPSPDAPLARMLPGHRPEAPKKEEPKDSETANMTVSIPAALRNRARAAYKATSYAEGDNTWSHFVTKAIEAETARREAEHNQGEMYPSWGEKLPGGRRLKDS
ncbi:hypothetical protein PV772_10030 [Pseudarthrobacter sp. CC12]|uniref:ParB family protein n=1 Tax=Pseudarthrobacter sp. CC12 TaxID=3029193 RepID=UPI003264087E